MSVPIVDHFLVRDARVSLRDRTTPPEPFRRAAARLTLLLAAERRHLEAAIDTPAVDRALNAQHVIVPGLGDFGERLYGTR